MASRREFLGSIAALGIAAGQAPGAAGVDYLGWKPHLLRKGDRKGNWIFRNAEYQFLHKPGGKYLMPFGVALMDNGEVLFAGSWNDGTSDDAAKAEKPVIGFSRDSGASWSALEPVPGGAGRPVMLAYAGGGNVFFQTDLEKSIRQFFSTDYGRTWASQPLQPALNGENYSGEGNMLVDRGPRGVRIAAVGYNFPKGTKWPRDPSYSMIRWSADGGHTWTGENSPAAWRSREEYNGTVYNRAISEGSLARAANGWLVAALRTDMPARFLDYHNDNLEGTGISLSKDDGRTWSPVKVLFAAGRMHAHLLRLRDGTLVMTHIMRQDIDNGRLASYRRGCGAAVSRDNGQNWDMAGRYVLDEFEFSDGKPNALACGHLFSTVLADGSILTAYGHYVAKGAALIRWKPDAA